METCIESARIPCNEITPDQIRPWAAKRSPASRNPSRRTTTAKAEKGRGYIDGPWPSVEPGMSRHRLWHQILLRDGQQSREISKPWPSTVRSVELLTPNVRNILPPMGRVEHVQAMDYRHNSLCVSSLRLSLGCLCWQLDCSLRRSMARCLGVLPHRLETYPSMPANSRISGLK